MKPQELRKMSDEELDIEVKRLRNKQFEIRTQAVTEKIHDTSRFGKLKHDIARVLTEQNIRKARAKAKA